MQRADSAEAAIETFRSLAESLAEEAREVRAATLVQPVNTFSGQHTSIPKYARALLERVSAIKVLYLRERRQPIGTKEATQLLELKVSRGGPEKLRKIQDTVSALLGVEIDAFRGVTKQAGEAVAELDVDRFLVQVNGAGIRESLRLILDYEFEQPNVLLVEEPEIHLHPALETSMMRYLKSCGVEGQIFITTHSTNFLDTAEMRNVYLVSKDEATRVQRLDVAEAEASIPRELGIRLSSLFMFDRLVFVEGPSDEEVIRELASILSANLAHASVGFVQMGGVRNFAHFAAEATLDFLGRRQVEMWFVIDRDEKDDAELQQIADRLGKKAHLVPLQKREMENYLIVPRALVQFIGQKQRMARIREPKEPSEADIRAALDRCADGLKDVAVERRVTRKSCSPLYPDRKAIQVQTGIPLANRVREQLTKVQVRLQEIEGNLEQTIEEQQRIVEAQWSSKYDIVPGDLLLDAVCAEYGVRFKKERDSARIAALLQPNEVAADLKGFIGDVVRDAVGPFPNS